MEDHSCPECFGPVTMGDAACASCGAEIAPGPTERSADSSVPSLSFRPGADFAGRYTIIEQVGAGGMGVVYKAVDFRLDCSVALKLIHPSMTLLPTLVERFRREVRITRQLTHPNICRVHDIGNEGDLIFLSMEWIEGETLRQLLPKAETLMPERALKIARQIAAALEAAHAKRVVHRDLKPANVMIDPRGQVRVMDFGLAHEQGAESLTGGMVVGTPRYMAPEQRRGGTVDARSDLYALGLILREMLTGKPTEWGTVSTSETLSREVSPLIVPVLERLLAEKPERRYASASAAGEALDGLLSNPAIQTSASFELPRTVPRRGSLWTVAIGLVVVALIATVVWNFWPRETRPLLEPRAQMFYDRGVEYLREQSETTRGANTAIGMFHRALEFQPDSPLVQARLGEAYWLLYRHTSSPAARTEAETAVHHAFLNGPDLPEVRNARAMGLIAEGKYAVARTELESVVAERPILASAWINLGLVHRALGQYAEGLEAYRRATEIEPHSFRIHIYLGRFHERFGEYAKAGAEYRLATELKPDSPLGWSNLGGALLYAGKYAESVEPLEHSIALDDNADGRSNLGTALFYLDRHDEAIEQYRRATELNPRNVAFWGNLAETLEVLGRNDERDATWRRAEKMARERVAREPLNPEALADLGLYCAIVNDVACAIENGSRAVDLQPENAELMRINAAIQCRLGRDDECLDWLGRAVRYGMSRTQIEGTPSFERLKGQPRYEEIMELAG